MEEQKLRQLFKNSSDCYADTEGEEVIQAMTEERFIKTLTEAGLLNKEKPKYNEMKVCGH